MCNTSCTSLVVTQAKAHNTLADIPYIQLTHLQDDDRGEPFHFDAFMRQAAGWIAASIGGALALGAVFVLLVRSNAKALVWTAITLQVGCMHACGGIVHMCTWYVYLGGEKMCVSVRACVCLCGFGFAIAASC